MTAPHHPHEIEYFVDEEAQTTTDSTLTVSQILSKAGLDPADHFLIELRGDHRLEHRDRNETIRIHPKERFISVFTGPTPVS